ncbi:MAG: thiamine-phosphate kinase [Gammaproteobacteria bacterium]|nr:thiamine-phosphate kinase [Gammaproteobacteria bacterium]
MKEFEVINKYFALNNVNRPDVLKGVGDDCALLKVPRGQRLAVSMDTLVAGVHFLEDISPEDLAHRSVAVNLSDLAAACAEPAWLTLSMTLPELDDSWLAGFSKGLKEITEFFGVQVVGGDTCKGPLSITIQAHGFVPESVYVSRNTAKAGELICVTGCLGDAALGLKVAQNKLKVKTDVAEQLLKKYYRPFPAIAAGIALRGRATSSIDISDGLLADVNHISQQSGVGALLRWERIPLSDSAKQVKDQTLVQQAALSGGDDYELCFSVKEDELEATQHALQVVGANCIPIGRFTGKPGVRLLHEKEEIPIKDMGYLHF